MIRQRCYRGFEFALPNGRRRLSEQDIRLAGDVEHRIQSLRFVRRLCERDHEPAVDLCEQIGLAINDQPVAERMNVELRY